MAINTTKKKKRSFFLLLFFMPALISAIILGVIFVIGYADFEPEEESIERLIEEAEALETAATDISNYFILPNGNGLIARSKVFNGLILEEVDFDTNTIVQTEQIESDIFLRLFSSYQQDGIILITKSDDSFIRAYYYESGSPLQRIDFPDLMATNYLENHVFIDEDTIFLVGETEDKSFALYSIKDLHLEEIDLTEDERIVDLVDVSSYRSSEYAELLPALFLNLYDKSNFIMTLSADPEKRVIIKQDGRPTWEMEEEAVATLYPGNDLKIIRVSNEKIVQYDMNTNTELQEISTPTPIYYPKAFRLNPDLALIIGREAVSESSDLIGYIYEQSSGNLIADLTEAFKQSNLTYDDSLIPTLQDDVLYLSSENMATSFNIDNLTRNDFLALDVAELAYQHSAEEITAEAESLSQKGYSFSQEKLLNYIKEDNFAITAIIIIAVFVIVPILILLSITSVLRIRKRKREKILENGGVVVQAVITEVTQTGVYINNQPQVRLQVEFEHDLQTHKHEVKLVTSLVAPLQPGDYINLLFDPYTGKVYKWNE